MSWKEIADVSIFCRTIKKVNANFKQKKHERDQKIPNEWVIKVHSTESSVIDKVKTTGLLSDRELLIISYDATELAKHISSKEYTSVEVITAYCKAASIAQQSVNCLTEIMFDKALKRAAD